jgi:hypothetical protein
MFQTVDFALLHWSRPSGSIFQGRSIPLPAKGRRILAAPTKRIDAIGRGKPSIMKALIHSSAGAAVDRLRSSQEASNDRENESREIAFAVGDGAPMEAEPRPLAEPQSEEERYSLRNSLELLYEINEGLKSEVQRLRQSEAELKARCEEFLKQ